MRSEPRVRRWRDREIGDTRSGGERRALSVLLTASRSAIDASTEAQLQLFSLVVAAPEPIRLRFRGKKLAAMLNAAATLRVESAVRHVPAARGLMCPASRASARCLAWTPPGGVR